MGSINSFGQAVQEILLNNYLKSNFEYSEIRYFVPTFRNFIRGKSYLKKSPLFRTLNANILRTTYDKKDKWAHFEILLLKTFIWR